MTAIFPIVQKVAFEFLSNNLRNKLLIDPGK
jgi:hypothetical protein